jgi:type IV secretory pathway protease TraF
MRTLDPKPKHRHRRALLIIALSALTSFFLARSFSLSPPLLLDNLTPSLTTGLYVRTLDRPEPGIIVALNPASINSTLLQTALARQAKTPWLLKRIAAGEGAHICVDADHVSINGETIRTREGRPAFEWQSCQILNPDQYFLLGDHPASIDSRDFGPVNATQIKGSYRLVWEITSAPTNPSAETEVPSKQIVP